jgi:hypothetical protein
METTATSPAASPIAVLSITWGNPPRFDRDVWERDGYPRIDGTAWLTFRGTAAMVGVGAYYRGESLDSLFMNGLEPEIRADIEWALAPFHDLTPAEVDAMVAAVINAVKAETVTE